MTPPSPDLNPRPDPTTDPARAGGGGQEAASALAARLVQEAAGDEEFLRRLSVVLGGNDPAVAALKLGISPEDAARAWEHVGPAAQVLRQVCVACRVSGHWLLTGQGDPHVGLGEVTERVREMIELVQRPSAPAAEPTAAPPPRERSTNDAGYEWL